MPNPAVTVEALPAGYGDSILVTCARRGRPWRLLVDTGPDECWPTLKARLAQIPPDKTGKRRIDLAIISHIDHDHIGGAGALFSDRELRLTFGDIWFNAPVMPASRGVAEGRSLAKLLGATDAALPWNKAWGGRHAVTSADPPFVELPQAAGKPKLTLLSPTPAKLTALFKVWKREVARLREAPAHEPTPVPRSREALDLAALAAKATAVDSAPANGSSIALLLEHRGVSVLLAADAHPGVLTSAVRALAARRGAALPLQVDAFKLSHHGSRANVTTALLAAVQAQHYIVSTNGAIFRHPDDEAIARVILHGGLGREIVFNYATAKTVKWGDAQMQQAHGYGTRLPKNGEPGVLIELAGQPR